MRFHKKVLKNGLRIIVIPIQGVESATTLVMAGAGSRYENKRNNGISHFLEHMAFKGTKNRPTAREISGLIDGIGAEFNAFTGKEYTGYYIKSATKYVDLCLDVLSDMLKNLLLDPKEIEKEKGVILEEINLYEDTPMRDISNVYEKLLYGDQPLGWDTAGSKANIKKITRDDFSSYMKSLYSASNMTVVIAGNVNKEKTEKLIEKYFGDIPKYKTIKFSKVKNDQQKSSIMSLKTKKTEQAHFALGVRTSGLDKSNERYPLSILSAILGGGMSSRLFHEVREKRGLAYHVRTDSDQYLDAGYLATFVGADPKRVEEAIRVVVDEYKKILKTGEITKEEVKKAKEYMKGHYLLGLEDTQNVAVLYATQEILRKEPRNPVEIIKKIDKVTLEDVKRMTKKYLNTKKLSLSVIGNFSDKSRFEKLLK